jgi:hypothetical protein
VSWDDALDGKFPSTYRQRFQQAAVRAAEQLSDGRPLDPARLAKALDLVLTNAVTLQSDGTATVKSGSHSYQINGECSCEDARHRTKHCKHALAVLIQRRATALLEGTVPVPASTPTPAAPSPSQAPAAPLSAAPSALASNAWDVHEAPASACFKFRVGNMELMYTLRGIDDDELQRRITATLPTLQEVIEACEERAAQRAAAREAQAAQAPQAPQAPPAPQPTSAPADLQTLIQQAVQQALNGQAHGTPPPAPPSTGPAAATGGAPFCHVHQAPLELRTNDRGSWWSHWVASEKRYCKGE